MTDLGLLKDLVESGKLSEEQEQAFSRMYDDLTAGKFKALTEKQRSWIEGVAARLGLDPGTENLVSSGKMKVSAEERKGVEAFLAGLGPKVLKPPGRR